MSGSLDRYVELNNLFGQFDATRQQIQVCHDFSGQINQIDCLLKNDYTSMVRTILDFQINSASVPIKLETDNENLNETLEQWQNIVLNRGSGVHIPAGLTALSKQFYYEYLRSSQIHLVIKWEKVRFGTETLEVPTEMRISDGSKIILDDKGDYFLGSGKITTTKMRSNIIRKPFNQWYDPVPSPYLVNRGVLYKSLFKKTILTKQADVVNSIMMHLLMIKAGNDKLAMNQLLAEKEELEALRDQVIKAQQDNMVNPLGQKIGTFNYDVDLQHLMPDLNKILDEKIIKPIDRDILFGLGMVELIGFSETRKEALLNPKVLVENTKDMLNCWLEVVQEVVYQMMVRNSKDHRKIANKKIEIIADPMEAFITDEMRKFLRSLYDRGVISKQSSLESTTELNFGTEVQRRIVEKSNDLEETMYPPVIQNLQTNEELEDQGKDPKTPEANNFIQAEQRVYETIDELPDEIRSSMSIPDQIKYIKSKKK